MRLIDADELIEHAWRDKLDSRELIAKMIDNAPTVKEIPTKIPIDIFEKLVSQEPKWIPVSERLPEESGEYLITIKDRTYLEISWFYPSDKKWSYRNADIIAWQPLPKPYKAESEDKE